MAFGSWSRSLTMRELRVDHVDGDGAALGGGQLDPVGAESGLGVDRRTGHHVVEKHGLDGVDPRPASALKTCFSLVNLVPVRSLASLRKASPSG